MTWLNIPVLVIAASLLLSLLSGLNQLVGFFSRVSLVTAIVSVIIAVGVALAFPTLIQRQEPGSGTVLNMPLRVFAVSFAVVILAIGVGPFLGKFWVAANSKTEGSQFVDLHRYAAAQVPLERATRYFADLGFSKKSTESKLGLAQAYAGMGDWTRAQALVDQITPGAQDPHLLAKLNVVRGNMAYERGEFEQAERFFELALQTVEDGSQAHAVLFQSQGVLWSGRGAPYRERVINNYHEARTIYENSEDRIGLVHILINEGALYEDQQKARSFYEQALTEAEMVGDPDLLGVIATNTGITYRQQGELDQAERYYKEALGKFAEAADLVGRAEVEVNLATVDQVRGRMELARQHVQASAAYLRNVDQRSREAHPRKVALIRTFQADIYDSFGESEAAERLYKEALALYSEHPDPLREAGAMVNYAGLMLRLNRNQEARNLIGRAREILEAFAEEGPHQSLGVLYNNLGKAYQDTGDVANALRYYQLAAEMFDALQDPAQYAQAIENVGTIRAFEQDFERAKQLYIEALDIYRSLENRDREAQTLFNLYSISGPTGGVNSPEMVRQIIALLDQHAIDQDTQAGILLGILAQDVDSPQLTVFRERLLQLKRFYEDRNEPAELGRSLLRLADVEQKLANVTQKPITRIVTIVVVYQTKIIKIKKHQRCPLVHSSAHCNGMLGNGYKSPAVGQTCQFIGG